MFHNATLFLVELIFTGVFCNLLRTWSNGQ